MPPVGIFGRDEAVRSFGVSLKLRPSQELAQKLAVLGAPQCHPQLAASGKGTASDDTSATPKLTHLCNLSEGKEACDRKLLALGNSFLLIRPSQTLIHIVQKAWLDTAPRFSRSNRLALFSFSDFRAGPTEGKTQDDTATPQPFSRAQLACAASDACLHVVIWRENFEMQSSRTHAV